MIKAAKKNRVNGKRVTYAALRRMLEAEGFVFSIVKSDITMNGEHSLFAHPDGAELRYPIFRPTDTVRPGHLSMARVALHWFGIMEEGDFYHWLEDPKHFQVA